MNRILIKSYKRIKNIFLYITVLGISSMGRPFAASADTLSFDKPTTGVIANIPALITWAIQILFVVAGLIAFVYLLLGGIKWITSGGDKGQVEAARNQIIQALIGLVVVFAAWGMIVLVEKLLGIGLGFSEPIALPDASQLENDPSFGNDPNCVPGQPC